ncbi:MAG: M3 family metallopeptidase, partial [Holophagales bacterium]|nr:M3 family metallopeptidase [Holophagales bacterium]
RLLGADELLLSDVYAPLPNSETAGWSFDRARDAIVASLAPLGAEVVAIAERAFGDGWIDVYPHAEKRDFGGVTNVFGVHPYILLNFKGGFDDVYVATHELGHAIQFWLTDEHQPCVNSSTSSFLFEIAAHFNEHLLVDHLLRTEESVGTRRFLLDKQATGVARAIFTQTMLAELELAMHEEVEAGGTLTADWLNDRYLALSREYYGHAEGAATVGDHEKHGWIPIPHLYMDYYVVNYATGMVASLALHHQLDKNPAHGVEAYVDFLKSGGSDFPLELLESAGIDMTTREPFEAAFAELERLVVDLELSLAAGEGGEASVGATP